MKYGLEKIIKAVESKGYKYFHDFNNKSYDVNVISVRNSSTGNKITNLFDDTLTISYKDINGEPIYKEFEVTTDPGKSLKSGVARLVPGQYRSTYTIRKHSNRYYALCQRFDKTVKVYRDRKVNGEYDNSEITEGIYGINIHYSGNIESIYVNNWSEGCTVFKRKKDFDEFMLICQKARIIHGNSFTYTLIESKDIIN